MKITIKSLDEKKARKNNQSSKLVTYTNGRYQSLTRINAPNGFHIRKVRRIFFRIKNEQVQRGINNSSYFF
jgi:hypothetical protein